MLDLRNKRITVMGLGVHGGGLGVTRFLLEQGAHVIVTDLRSAEILQPSLEALAGLPVEFVLGEHRDQDFERVDMVIRNPGVPRESRYLQLARAAGVAIEMEMTLFFRLCPAPIIGITGTKGKTTTTTLTGAMLREVYPDTVVAGNLRVSALEQLPRITAKTPVVLELSSWQLEGLGEAGLSPEYACVTNLSPDHLDRYGSMADYGLAKQQIFLYQSPDDVVVLPKHDLIVNTWANDAPGRVIWFDGNEGWPMGQLQGQHNALNIAAAAALAQAYGVPDAAIRKAIEHFAGVEHRMELVREINGVRLINDTAATTPTAAAAALNSMTSPVILIAGGADKKLAWTPLVEAIQQSAQLKRLIILDGTGSPALSAALGTEQERYQSFEQAIRAAFAEAEAGDTVLLSPGAASFGMFRNEFHRGEEFRRIVGLLTEA
ncbi:MAG TPA: UDP-N-acetylmuramoyl-L-alanine--D-glutamate ligase [Herpetosiphon sp.]|uniref:UDP-N-acetylmuramoylalanine--D-glutamate ligase n=1 Tax=Herpetosiphon aurantiacus (strain ATCC 23779 / DSM 785 / 114-95) TaxID=316274 RepID=A9B513_HERA2|nr:UDP-N-acetylmuramoyl-L-alanine--D-glutamate ligase [Herpetosiphon sp.]ABX06150.1 UDP-N-acetylmuramoylalanine--D-glutamate ligase [Herpetosiphon aurantiacus DSM 785]HBW51340.1 UDP-N-acetylmuramoyl-L-alanine--D-glutamate ligase [Herpetosiphon sp.]